MANLSVLFLLQAATHFKGSSTQDQLSRGLTALQPLVGAIPINARAKAAFTTPVLAGERLPS
jgi:hypothetical protein